MTRPDLPTLARARRLVDDGAVDLFTCDVFDTLLWRDVAQPHHLFIRLARRLAAEGALPVHVTNQDFMGGRVHAEQAARGANWKASGCVECTLTEIWKRMPDTWCGARDDRKRYVDAELDVERSALRVHDDVAALLRHAHAASVRTALVSDTYFSAEQLRDLLDHAGAPLDAIDEIVVSCDVGQPKWEGLLDLTIERAGVEPARTMHLGDNPVADVRSAERAGAIALAAARPHTELAAPAVLAEVRDWSAGAGTDAGVTATTAAELLAAGDDAAQADVQFGITVGGPVLHGFARWIAATAEELAVDRVHCLLREGDTIATLLADVAPHGPRPLRVHASRWVNMRAAVIHGTPDEIFRATARKAVFHPAHVATAFDIDEGLVTRVIGTAPIVDDERVAAIEAIADDDTLRESIVASSAVMRARLVRYLDAVLRPTDGRLVVSDIGWGGTIQESLRDILLHEGRIDDPDDIIGLYLMLSAPGVRRAQQGQRLLSYFPVDHAHRHEMGVISRNPEIFEQLCTPDTGTLLDITDDGEPIVAAEDPTSTSSRTRTRQSALGAARRLATVEPPTPDPWLDRGFRAALMRGTATTLQAPTAELGAALGRWLHDDVAGDTATPLADAEQLGFLAHVSAAAAGDLTMRDVFWLPGAAAVGNPTLAAQLHAVHLGVDADALSPPSETGHASIAVFAPGDQDAVALERRIPATGPHGRALVRLAATVPAVRDIRVDFGDVGDQLVEFDHLSIRLRCDGGLHELDINDATDDRLRWVTARPIGPSLVAVRAGGHLLVPLAGSPLAASNFVEARCAFRAAAIDRATAAELLRPSLSERASGLARRVVRAVRHRGGRP